MTKKKVIITILTLTITIGGIFSVYAINKNINTNKEITATTLNIKKVYTNFNKEQDRANKINDLKTMVLALNNNKLKSEIIVKDYNEKIKNMKQYFTNDYDKNLKDNLVNSEDKDVLTTQTNNLNTLLNTIKSEKDIVLNHNQFQNYQVKINEIVKTNTVKIQGIETIIKAKEEADAKIATDKKAAEDAKVIADAKVVANKTISSNSTTNDSNSNTNNNNTTSKSSNNTTSKSSTTKSITTPKTTTVAKKAVTPKKTTTPKATKSNNGKVTGHSWSVDGSGNKIAGTTTAHYGDGSIQGPDGVIHSSDSY